MAATIGLVLDCTNPGQLAHFWSEALGFTILGGAGSYVMLIDPDGVRPKLLLQAVPEASRPRTGCTSTSKHPTSTAKPPVSSHSARDGSSPASAASTGPTG